MAGALITYLAWTLGAECPAWCTALLEVDILEPKRRTEGLPETVELDQQGVAGLAVERTVGVLDRQGAPGTAIGEGRAGDICSGSRPRMKRRVDAFGTYEEVPALWRDR